MHKINITRKPLLFIFVFIVYVSGLLSDAEKFRLSKNRTKATAIVSSNEFEVRLNPGNLGDYKGYFEHLIRFDLIVGEDCKLEIDGYKAGTAIFYTKQSDPNFWTSSPNKIKVASDKVRLLGVSSLFNVSCAPKFEEFPDDKSKFLITFELSGEIPPNLILFSDDELYDPGLKVWQIAAIVVGVIILLFIVSSVVSGIVFCVRKRKKQLQEQATLNTEVKTAGSTEDKVISNSKLIQEPKKDKKLSKNVSKKREDKLVSEAQMRIVLRMNEDSRKQDVSQSQK